MTKRHPRHSVPTGAMARARILFAMLAVLVVLCACDSRKKGAAALDECEQYAHMIKSCFGERAAARANAWLARPIDSDGARESMKKRCSTQTAKIRQVCR